MEEGIFADSSEVSASANHTRSNVVHHDGSEVQDTDRQLLCNNKTLVEAMTSDPTEGVELVDTAVLQVSSASAEASDARAGVPTAAGDMSGTNNDSQHSDMVQPSVNGDGNVQQSDKEKMLDLSSTRLNPELELATGQAKQKFGAFHQLDHPASVVIDLRSPPLVQVCLLHGEDDLGAGGSGSSSSTGAHRRPQTARRGRRLHSGMTHRATGAVRLNTEGSSDTSVPTDQLVANNGEGSCSVDEKAAAELSTIIRLKVIDTPTDMIGSEHLELSPVTDNMSGSHIRLSHHRDDGHGSESSDDDTMRVRNVNRTYSRNPSVPSAGKNPPQITTAKSTYYRDSKKGSEVSSGFSTRIAQGFKSVPKKSKKNVKQQTRIGPAWFSRRSLNSPPPEIWKCARTSKSLKTLKRPNYNSGVRRLPIVAMPPIVKQMLDVPVSEEGDIDAVGREELKLWRLSDEDVIELQSQLRQEAEHRRSEHIMPLVMQMTDAQIEHAYEHVAESMKTYEIVEADSDEDEDMAEDEESEREVADDYDTTDNLKSSEWSIDDEINAERFGETEYSRSRPKRHAVDYGPSAFAPILMMEGRRLFSRQRKSSKESRINSADVADQSKLQQHSRGYKSRGRRRQKNRITDEVPADTPAEKCAGDMDSSTGYFCF